MPQHAYSPKQRPRWRQQVKHLLTLSGIQRALLLYVVLPILAVVGIGIGVGLERMNVQESDRLKDDLELLGRAIRVPVGEALAAGDEEAVQRALDSVFEIGRVYGASVFDVNGNRVAVAGIAERDLSRSRLTQELVMTGEQQERVRQISGVQMYSHFIPVFDDFRQANGFIQINRQASDFDASFKRLSLWAWGIWASMAVLTITMVIFGHYRGVGRYVSTLRQSMNQVESGDTAYRAPTDGPGELATIARGLNQMLDSLQANEQELAARRQHEQELSLQLQHQEKMAAIGNVASGIAHELGAPLTVIDGRARRLLKVHTDSESSRQLKAIRGQVGRLTRIVQQLLNYCRPASGDEQPNSPVDLARLLPEVTNSVRFEQATGAPQFVLESSPLPQGLQLLASEARLELALVNVVRNAAQVAQQAVHISVQVAANQQQPPQVAFTQHPPSMVVSGARWLMITVTDDGPGLPPERSQQELLKPFFSTKGEGQGTGLGLAIVDNVVREHGGALLIANRDDGAQGCRVVLWLPLKETEQE